MSKRPQLTRRLAAKDFRDFYWLKAELVDFCRAQDLPVGGSKGELTARIGEWLDSGKITRPAPKREPRRSDFDWHSAPLTRRTVITDSYRSTQNVRRFFRKNIGDSFSFNVTFMNWMKSNAGKTMDDALVEWQRIREERTAPGFKPDIAPQFEYNAYVQAFLAANPALSRAEAIVCWKQKKSRRGHNRYGPTDLKFLQSTGTQRQKT